MGFVLPQAVFLLIEFLKSFTGFVRADVPQGFANCGYCLCLDGFSFYRRELEAAYAELAFDRRQQEVLNRAFTRQLTDCHRNPGPYKGYASSRSVLAEGESSEVLQHLEKFPQGSCALDPGQAVNRLFLNIDVWVIE